MFADNVEIEVTAGKGGDGRMGFRHEKYRAKGGPDGGDGGDGGSVIFEVDHNLGTLAHFRNHRTVAADPGQAGGVNRSHGKSGVDVVIKVPIGTLVYEGEVKLFDLTTDGQQTVVAKGGRGGFGNAHFTSSTRQTPRVAELGEPGEEKQLRLELKLVADIGLVGLPNAGKSTLLSVISNARPEIADYAFTTLIPNLGVAEIDDDALVVADIPGLIEGASKGKGLGDEFLRHIERTAVLLHLIDINSANVLADYKTIQKELKQYAADLTTKPQIVVLTKIEAQPEAVVSKLQQKLTKASKGLVLAISAQAHQGLLELLRAAKTAVVETRAATEAAAKAAVKVYDLSNVAVEGPRWKVERKGKNWLVRGSQIEGFARRTDFASSGALERLRDIMRRQGIAAELEKRGIKPGDTIKIGAAELDW